MKRRGVNYVTFSLDGQNEEHDQSRHQVGLYRKILDGFKKVKRAGLSPRVSLLIRPEWTDEQMMSFLVEPATIIYDLDPQTPARKRALRLSLDPTNAISNFIDIGNGAGDDRMQSPIMEGRDHALYCSNFYRLSPSLTVKANGELATCRLSQVGEGYGNIHQRTLAEILNHFDEAFVYQLHASHQLDQYLPLVDRSLFGSAFTHLCSLQSIVTLVARTMHEQGISPDDAAAVQRIIREVAVATGHYSSHLFSSLVSLLELAYTGTKRIRVMNGAIIMDKTQALQNLLNGTASEEEEINLPKGELASWEIAIGGNFNQLTRGR